MKRRKTQNAQSALAFVAGDKQFTLDHADLQRFPDSLLHGLCTDVESAEPINIDVDSSLESPFTSWEPAVPLTVEVYRHGVFPMTTLCELVKTHTALDLISRLTALSDYLALPRPLIKLLPDKKTVPLMYAGVHELYSYALAVPAANSMMLSTAFAHTSKACSEAVAMFYVTLTRDPELSVYAIKPADAVALHCSDRHAVEARVWRLDSMGKAGSQLHTLHDLARATTQHGTPVTIVKHPNSLGASLAAALSQAVKDVHVGGRTGVMRVECREVIVLPQKEHRRTSGSIRVPVWVVKWL